MAITNKHPGEIKDLIFETLESDKAEDIQIIDLTGKSALADYMIIASGRSSRHISAIAKHLYDKVKPITGAFHSEGEEKGDWVVVDTGDVIIHLFRPEVREFYKIEKLWTDLQSFRADQNRGAPQPLEVLPS